jgi:hypothetical protein
MAMKSNTFRKTTVAVALAAAIGLPVTASATLDTISPFNSDFTDYGGNPVTGINQFETQGIGYVIQSTDASGNVQNGDRYYETFYFDVSNYVQGISIPGISELIGTDNHLYLLGESGGTFDTTTNTFNSDFGRLSMILQEGGVSTPHLNPNDQAFADVVGAFQTALTGGTFSLCDPTVPASCATDSLATTPPIQYQDSGAGTTVLPGGVTDTVLATMNLAGGTDTQLSGIPPATQNVGSGNSGTFQLAGAVASCVPGTAGHDLFSDPTTGANLCDGANLDALSSLYYWAANGRVTNQAGSINTYGNDSGQHFFDVTQIIGDALDPSRPVPEPATLALLGLGALGMGVTGRRRKRAGA